MPAPRISVVITTKDYARFLSKAIESVLNQSLGMEQIELIVVDDGSVDETAQVAARYSGTICYIYQENRGQGGALNTGLKAAHGEYIALLDADDYFYKTKLEEVLDKFNQDSRIGMVQHRLDVVDHEGQIIYTTPFRLRLDEGWLRERLIKYGGSWYSFVSVAASALTFRRRDLRDILPIPEEMLRMSADNYLVTQVSLHSYIGAIHKSLGAYCLHGKNYWSTSVLTAEIIQDRFITPMANTSKLVKQRLSHEAHFVDVRDDPYYAELCCVLEKLKGRRRYLLWNYVFFVRAIYRDSRITGGYKFWRILSTSPMLFVPHRIYFMFKRWYAVSNLFYGLRAKVLPRADKKRQIA